MTQITHFEGEYWFLSNFYPAPVVLDETEYPTVEHAFQAAKTDDPDERRAVLASKTPALAKRAGRAVTMRPDWNTARFATMESLVQQKFTRHADLRAKLLATGDAELIEGNTWNDTTWGAVWDGDNAAWIGKNYLGQMLMRIRDELRREFA